MTKEQEQFERLENERRDYYCVLNLLKGNEGLVYLRPEARKTIMKAINADLTCLDSLIREFKKKGGKNEQV